MTAVTSTCGGCLIDHTQIYATSCADRTQMDTPFQEISKSPIFHYSCSNDY